MILGLAILNSFLLLTMKSISPVIARLLLSYLLLLIYLGLSSLTFISYNYLFYEMLTIYSSFGEL